MADYLVERHGFRLAHFKTPLLFSVSMLVAPQRKPYTPEYRRLLQEVGSAFRRYNPDSLVQCQEKFNGKRYLVLDDVRFRNEAAWVKDNGGILWRIVTPSIECDHESETDLDAYDGWDAVYQREDGTPIETAYEWVDEFLATLSSR